MNESKGGLELDVDSGALIPFHTSPSGPIRVAPTHDKPPACKTMLPNSHYTISQQACILLSYFPLYFESRTH